MVGAKQAIEGMGKGGRGGVGDAQRQRPHIEGDETKRRTAHKLVRIVHLGVAPIQLLEKAPARVAMQGHGSMVQRRARLWQRKEVQAACAIKESRCWRSTEEEHCKDAGRNRWEHLETGNTDTDTAQT